MAAARPSSSRGTMAASRTAKMSPPLMLSRTSMKFGLPSGPMLNSSMRIRGSLAFRGELRGCSVAGSVVDQLESARPEAAAAASVRAVGHGLPVHVVGDQLAGVHD